jgi:hypothetical protein
MKKMGGKFERAPSLGEISQTTMILLKMENVEPSHSVIVK